MPEQVTVLINPKTGEQTFEVEGVTGGACTDITEALTEGNEHVETQYTEEYCVPDTLPAYEGE